MKKGRTNEKKERKRKTSGGQTARKKVPVRFLNNSRLQQPPTRGCCPTHLRHHCGCMAARNSHTRQRHFSRSPHEASARLAATAKPHARLPRHSSSISHSPPSLTSTHKKHRERQRETHTDTEGRGRYERDQKKNNFRWTSHSSTST
jgi:hypothetical protein